MTEQGPTTNPDHCSETDLAMKQWSQGDVAVGLPMLWYSLNGRPITDTAAADTPFDDNPLQIIEGDVGLMAVVSQTCDIHKRSDRQPYVQLAPVVDLADTTVLREAQGGHSTQFAPLPALGPTVFADLHREVTVEKPVLTALERHTGCNTAEELDRFAMATARNRRRFAFPDGAEQLFNPLRDYLREKRNKHTSEAARIGEVEEIRARDDNNWAGPTCEMTITFLVTPSALPPFDPDAVTTDAVTEWLQADRTIEQVAARLNDDGLEFGDIAALWQRLVELWCVRCQSNDTIRLVDVAVESMDGFSLWRARAEPKLELDHLSGG